MLKKIRDSNEKSLTHRTLHLMSMTFVMKSLIEQSKFPTNEIGNEFHPTEKMSQHSVRKKQNFFKMRNFLTLEENER